MKALPIEVEAGGRLRLAHDVVLPDNARLAVLILDPADPRPGELSGKSISILAEQSGALDFLKEEPEIYSDQDILPGRKNPGFRQQG